MTMLIGLPAVSAKETNWIIYIFLLGAQILQLKLYVFKVFKLMKKKKH